MNEFIRDTLVQFLTQNWMLIALIVASITALGMAVGSIKKLIGKIVNGAFDAGDKLATKIMQKPKGLLLLGSLVGLTLPAWLVGYMRAPEKIVEKPVIERVVVSDNSEIARLNGLLAQTDGQHAQIMNRANVLEQQVLAERQAVAVAQKDAAESREKAAQADARVAEMHEKLFPKKPKTIDRQIRDLMKLFDWEHNALIEAERKQMYKAGQREKLDDVYDDMRFRWQYIKYIDGKPQERPAWFFVHPECDKCERNWQIGTKIQELWDAKEGNGRSIR
jgi:hypothetical protein